jgi:hypothetical protein
MKKTKNYTTYISLICIFLGTSFSSYSQEKKQEFSIAIGGPFSYIDYRVATGEIVPGNGLNVGLRYSHYLNEGLSVGLGIEYQSYNSEIKFQQLSGAYTEIDSENESFQFRYKATNLREEQKLGYVNIPIGIQFETTGTTKFYISGGAKIGFAVNGNYETTMQNLTTSGYYPQYNVELFSPTFAGFASTDNVKIDKQDLNTKISYSTTLETGLKQLIGKNNSIYIGVYLDYGLNNIYNKNENKIVQYNPDTPVQLQHNSILDSQYSSDVTLISYGFKLRFAIR